MSRIVGFGPVAAFIAVMLLAGQIGPLAVLGIHFPEQDRDMMLLLAAAACVALAFACTKPLFNANNFRSADIAIWGLAALFGLQALIAAAYLADLALNWEWAASAWVRGIAVLAGCALIGFAIPAMRFARHGGGGIWKAVGVLYLLVAIPLILAVGAAWLTTKDAPDTSGIAHVGGLLLAASGLFAVAALSVHGIGLRKGAAKMRA